MFLSVHVQKTIGESKRIKGGKKGEAVYSLVEWPKVILSLGYERYKIKDHMKRVGWERGVGSAGWSDMTEPSCLGGSMTREYRHCNSMLCIPFVLSVSPSTLPPPHYPNPTQTEHTYIAFSFWSSVQPQKKYAARERNKQRYQQHQNVFDFCLCTQTKGEVRFVVGYVIFPTEGEQDDEKRGSERQ
jgi:hypothetical protein